VDAGMGGVALAAQLLEMKEAMRKMPKALDRTIGVLETILSRYETMLERMGALVEIAGRNAQALEDIREDVDRAAAEIHQRNEDYARERAEREGS
jgi:hypothetical protein